jgi:putative hydrolase of the HAD superfamily
MIPEHLAARLSPLEPIPTGITPVLPDLRKIEAVLFDVYGTLFISGSGDISLAQSAGQADESLATLLSEFGIETPPELFQEQFFAAIRDSHATSKKNGQDYPEVEIDVVWQTVTGLEDLQRVRAFAIEYEILVNPVGPMPHLAEVLAACRTAGTAMGIISNAQFFTPLLFDWFLDAAPGELGFSEELLFYSWQWGLAKPSEKLFRTAARRLSARGIDLRNTIYMGNDMLNDILPARAAGFQTALFAGDQRSLRLRRDDPRCTNLKPDMILTDLIQLVELFDIR